MTIKATTYKQKKTLVIKATITVLFSKRNSNNNTNKKCLQSQYCYCQQEKIFWNGKFSEIYYNTNTKKKKNNVKRQQCY